jgi:hypothetical protein
MYGIASGLVGFRSTSLRVRIERTEGEYVWVRTASLLDAGTPLVLRRAQVEPETDAEASVRHRDGLVLLG